MDWRIFAATFWTIFLAELGDKTQLANFSMTAKTGSKFTVLISSVAAFALVTLLTVYLGGFIGKFISPGIIRYGASSLFIIIGFLMLIGKI